MKSIEQLKEEQKHLKAELAELVDFIASENYYALTDSEKGLINQQRAGMELYLSTLTKRIYGKADASDTTNMVWLTLLYSMFNTGGFGGYNSTDSLKKSFDNMDDKVYSFPHE